MIQLDNIPYYIIRILDVCRFLKYIPIYNYTGKDLKNVNIDSLPLKQRLMSIVIWEKCDEK